MIFGGSAVTLLAAGWQYVKQGLWWACGLLICRREIRDYRQSILIMETLVARYGWPSSASKAYDMRTAPHPKTGWVRAHYETLGYRTSVYWNGWWPVVMAHGDQSIGVNIKLTKSDGSSAAPITLQATVTFLRGTLDYEGLLLEAIAEDTRHDLAADTMKFRIVRFPAPGLASDGSVVMEESDSGKQWFEDKCLRLIGVDASQLGIPTTERVGALDRLIFPANIRNMITDVRHWILSREWYRERNLPWKRGLLLHGKPGTGKTAIARAFAVELNMPLFVFALGEMTNGNFLGSWSQIQHITPRMILFEDIDNVFHGRVNVAPVDMLGIDFMQPRQIGGEPSIDKAGSPPKSRPSRVMAGPVQFDTLLNVLDGVEKADGVFVILTTNDVSKVDPALGGPDESGVCQPRPGRVDSVLNMPDLSRDGKRQMAARIMAGLPEALAEITAAIDAEIDPVETPAQFQFRCGQAALAAYWAAKDKPAFQDCEVTGDDFYPQLARAVKPGYRSTPKSPFPYTDDGAVAKDGRAYVISGSGVAPNNHPL